MANRLEERHGYLQYKPARQPPPEFDERDDLDIEETMEMEAPPEDSNVLPLSERKNSGSGRGSD